ncbi:MAG: cellulose binding domain-containing protein, partial [Coleofasciculus sp. S288]|nr:cellulose binding domain-containing protein [Coleofasciculus sp. S288]
MTNSSIDFALTSDWGQGFSASMSIANNGNSNLNGWTLEFDFPYAITQIWNAEIVSRTGDRYVIRNASWNGTVPPDGTASFGFVGGPGNVTTEPSSYVLNGQSLGTSTLLPTLSIGDTTIAEGNAGNTLASFRVGLSQASGKSVTVDYTTADGTAKAGSDYTAKSGSVTFAPGETSKTIAVPIIGDTRVEPNETFAVNLSKPSNATITDAQAIGTIRNDDVSSTLPQLSISDASFTEGNSGTTNRGFTVKLSAASTKTVTVGYATADGTAKAGSDYTAKSGSVTFTPGETSKTISVPIVGDTTVESNETFTVNLSKPSNATITDAQAKGTIRNDDASPTLPQLSINDVSFTEGNSGTTNGVFTVKLSAASTQTVSVGYATADGTAK